MAKGMEGNYKHIKTNILFMNGQELYDLVTALLDGEEISTTLFVTLANEKKLQRELRRDWQVLKTKASLGTVSPSTTPDTAFSLPERCLRPIKNTLRSRAVVFLDASGNKAGGADEILFERQYDFTNTPGKFYIDHSDKTLHFTGNPPVPENRTAMLFYIKGSAPITYVENAGTGWEPFSSTDGGIDFSPLLAFDIAMSQKGSIDYDDINARMVQYVGRDAEDLEYAMNKWDDMMKLSALQV